MTPPEEQHHILLHGLGMEGTAALSWLLSVSPAAITLVDRPERLAELRSTFPAEREITCLDEIAAFAKISQLDPSTIYLRSPGIPPDNALVQAALTAGLSMTTPTGYWLATAAPPETVTVTGTKGKSSTVSLAAALLEAAGRKALAVGNIGVPPFMAEIIPDTVLIVETSSYMMHDLPPLPFLHVVTSLYHEHTPWHGSHAAYAAAKFGPFSRPASARGIVTSTLAEKARAAGGSPAIAEEIVPARDNCLDIAGERICPAELNDAFAAPSLFAALRMATAIAIEGRFISREAAADALRKLLPGWRGLPSRQFCLDTEDGILWVDDALATVPEAVLSALTRWADRPVHLLLGGADRGQDFLPLTRHFASIQQLHLYSYGDTDEKVARAAEEAGVSGRLSRFGTFEDMILTARNRAQPGDVILFSPAAPTAPPHRDYRERAALFAQIANQG